MQKTARLPGCRDLLPLMEHQLMRRMRHLMQWNLLELMTLHVMVRGLIHRFQGLMLTLPIRTLPLTRRGTSLKLIKRLLMPATGNFLRQGELTMISCRMEAAAIQTKPCWNRMYLKRRNHTMHPVHV